MLKTIYKKTPPILLLTHLVLALLFCLYVSIYTTSLGGDTIEHMHSSYLVHINSIPYKDFFQHHNPLLWYIFAPIMGLFDIGVTDNFLTAFVISSAIIVSFINYLYLFLITKKFLSNNLGGIIAASVAITPYIVLSIIHFRPDNFMLTSFFAGLYHYFRYLEQKKLKDLSISFFLFWCSFMFLQKIIFTLLLLGLITLYLIFKKKVLLSDILYSIMLPITLSICFIAYLYSHDILSVWYHSNFTFNLHIPLLFDQKRIGYIWLEFRVLLVLSILALIFCIKKSSIYFKIIAIIFVFEAIQRFFYFSAFAYYYCLLVYICSILSATFLSNIVFKKYYWMSYLLALPLLFCMYKPDIYNGNIGSKKPRFYQTLHREILHHITKCDNILNGDGTIYNVYNKDSHYYWNLLGQTDVIGAKVGIAPLMDINHVIKTKKPRIITITPYKDKYSSERGIDRIVHLPDMNYINKYYKPYTNYSNLYILKPEYSNLDCKKHQNF